MALVAFPGVVVYVWHVVPGAPGCPGPFGLVFAKTDVTGSKAKAAPKMARKMTLTRKRFIVPFLS